MFGKTLLVWSLLLFAVVNIEAEIVSFRANKNVLKQRDEAVLTCEFSKPIPFGAKFHITKFYGNQSQQFDEAEAFERFDFDTDDSDPTVARVKLTITNVELGDSGNYSCSLMQNHITTYRFLHLAVEDEPDTIKFFLDDKEIVNQSVKLRPNNAYRLRCETTGSNPRANISIMYGGVTLIPTNVSNSSAILRYDRKGNLPFLIPIEYNTTANVSRWVFTADTFPSSALSCSAKVNANASGISTSFYPDIEEGAPFFVCNDTVYASNNQKDFSINCTLYSKPTLTKARFFFNTGKDDLSINGYPWGQETSTADRNYRGIVKAVNDLKFIMNLTISSTDTRASIKFNFEAGNDRGTTIHSVTLMDKAMASFASPVKSALTTLISAAVLDLAFLCHRWR